MCHFLQYLLCTHCFFASLFFLSLILSFCTSAPFMDSLSMFSIVLQDVAIEYIFTGLTIQFQLHFLFLVLCTYKSYTCVKALVSDKNFEQYKNIFQLIYIYMYIKLRLILKLPLRLHIKVFDCFHFLHNSRSTYFSLIFAQRR